MAKKAKHRKNTTSTSSPEGQSPSPRKTPRLDPQKRQLSRFYEPLVLLHTLGSTRGEHTCAAPFLQDNVSHLPTKELRRRFLTELSYMCDYDKGGDTVTSISLESTPQGCVFWVASNSCPKRKIVPFLESLLASLKRMSATMATHEVQEPEEIAEQCINFATPRVKKYTSLLKPLLQRCLAWIAKTDQVDVDSLTEWLRSWDLPRTPIDLCRLAHETRKSDFMRTLARLSTEPAYKSNEDAIHNAFRLIRHYIGRLGYHFRAANVLVSCASRFPELFDSYAVSGISTPPKSALTPADGLTRLDSIIVRMLPAASPDLDRYQQALAEMDTKYDLSRHFLDNYAGGNIKPRVHAEIQVLDHFFASKLSFVGSDPFIACSKPACFCCLLYFRHHPGHFVEPASHLKIYLNWRPPDIIAGNEVLGPEYQKNVLNAMIKDIRKEALRQIDEKSAPRAWHPDSLTGITESAVLNQWEETLEEAGDVLVAAEQRILFNKDSSGSEVLPNITVLTLFPVTLHAAGAVRLDSSPCEEYETSAHKSQSVFDVFEDDSGEEGGVPL